MDEEYIGERTDAQGGRGARAAPSRQGQQVARQGTSGRPPGGRGAERMDGPGWQGRAGLCHDEGSPGRRRSMRQGQRAARRGTSGRPRGQASGAGVGRVRVRADVDDSGGGQGVTGRTTRDRARAVDAASATTSQTTQARCHTGTSFIHCRRLETYNLISIHNSFYYLLPRECGGQRADEEQQAAGSSSESSNIADVLDELRGIPPERDRKVESSLMPASQSSY